MMVNLEVEQIAHHRFYLLNARVAKFHYLAAVNANYMVVLLVAVGFFVLGNVFAKLMPLNQIAIYEQLQRIINRGAANIVLLVFHFNVQRFGIEMVNASVYFLQYGIAFRRATLTVFFQISGKNFAGFQRARIIGFHV